MLYPPPNFRHIKDNLSISGPLKPENIDFLTTTGCHKILGIAGLQVDTAALAKIKNKMMHFEFYTLTVDSFEERLLVDQLDRALKKVRTFLTKGSRLHIACGPDMTQIACLIGVMRQIDDEWTPSAAAAEALEICRYADADLVLDIVYNTPTKVR